VPLQIPTLGRGLLATAGTIVVGPAVAFRSIADSGIGSNDTVTRGTVTNGDTVVLIAWYLNDNASTTPSTATCAAPAGFTSRLKTTKNFVSSGTAPTNKQINVEVWTKVAASEGSTYQVVPGNNDAGAPCYVNVACLALQNVSATTPVGASSGNSGGPSSSSGTATGTGISPTRDGSFLVWIYGGWSMDATLPSGMTARVTDLDGVQGVATLAVNAGATGNKTATVAGDSSQENAWIAQLIAFQPTP
jgi:hypothetical protein